MVWVTSSTFVLSLPILTFCSLSTLARLARQNLSHTTGSNPSSMFSGASNSSTAFGIRESPSDGPVPNNAPSLNGLFSVCFHPLNPVKQHLLFLKITRQAHVTIRSCNFSEIIPWTAFVKLTELVNYVSRDVKKLFVESFVKKLKKKANDL